VEQNIRKNIKPDFEKLWVWFLRVLTIYFPAVAYSDNMNRFLGRIYFVDDAVNIGFSKRIATFFIPLQGFPLIGAVNKGVNGIYEAR